MKNLLLISLLLLSNLLFAEDIVTIKFLHGSAVAKLSSGESKTIAPLQTYPEGTIIKTSIDSYAKLVFIDKSELIMAPNTLIKIAKFSKTEPGILHLIKGIIRSKVSKDYMKIDDKNKSKLLIRTNYAALGIRGTYFQVEYNENSDNTLLHMFEGKVAFNKIDDENQKKELNQDELDSILNNKERILVTKGLSTLVNKDDKKPRPPKNFDISKLKLKDKNPNIKSNDLKPSPNKSTEEKKKVNENIARENKDDSKKEALREEKRELKREENREELREMRKEELKPDNRREEIQQIKNNLERK